MTCQVCLSTLKVGDLFCSSCGAAVPDRPATASGAPANEVRGRIAGERKYLTVLCVDLQRSTDLISDLDPEEAITRLEPALVAMRTAVRRNRGIVSKEGGDGLIALFGAPQADDNHAVMACHAAVEMVRRIRLLNDPELHVRVGLHSGYVVTHTIEADLSSIYEAGGPAVHLVKRFEGAAQPGQILVSESCQNLSTGLVTFKRLPPRKMEGFPAPVPCYELVEISGLTRWGARSTRGLSSFVGRTEETSILEGVAQEARTSGQIAALVGTAGVGKSRMAHEFAEDQRQQGWQVVEAECNPLEQNVPYSLLKKLLQALLRAGDLSLESAAAPAEGAPTHSDLWPAALSAVLDRPVIDSRWATLEPLLRRRVIIDAVCNVAVRVISRQPTLLLLEDLHWIDSQSETAIEALISMAAGRPILMLLTWRTEDNPGWLSKLDVQRIWLRSLDADSANALLDSLLGKEEGLAALKSRILRHTGQIPLFIEEVARQLIDRGIARSGAGRFAEAAQWEALEIPPTVQGVIASRIDRLPKEDKSLLQLAAVVGSRVSPELLATVTGMPRAQLQSRLWSLEILDFLNESRAMSQPDYVFAHDLVREVAYDSILRSQREVMHRRILTALESSGAREEDIAEALCYHASRAEEWGKADRYGHMAARKAFARSAFRDAADYFQLAIEAVDKQPESTLREQRAVDLRIEARLAFASLGSLEQWFDFCRDAEARSEKIGDEERRLASMAVRAAATNFCGMPYEAISLGQEAVALATKLNNTTYLGFAEYGLGQSYSLAGRYRDAESHVLKATRLLAAAPNDVPPGTTGSNLLVLCHMMRSLIFSSMGEFEDAERCSEQAAELARKNDRPYDLIAASYSRGFMELMRGNIGEAELALGQAFRLSHESEIRLFLPLIMWALGNLHIQKGKIAEAHDILLRAKDEAQNLGNDATAVAVSAYLGIASSQLGDASGGLALVRGCKAGSKQKGYGGIEALAAFAEAVILSSQGDATTEEAIGCVKQAMDIATELEARPLLASARGFMARLLAAAGRSGEARKEMHQAIALFDQSKMTIHLERARAELSKFPDM
ncbi:MAG: AAA family ATPase [Bradyrhizobium sp.]|uniref:ATP-binding protein n=1 Tax=Bradyrhizobium sp. TaxID=376 RepID=UPI003D0BB007